MSKLAETKPTSELSQFPWWEQILRGERKGILAQALRRAAELGSWGYLAVVRGREVAYRRGWIRARRLPRLTICVGNITVGGTGKTPLVIRLANDLGEQGVKVGVLLRGYKRENVTRTPVIVRDPRGIRASVRDAGDEAMELAKRLTKACVGVGANRYAVGRALLERYPIDCFILDDGFQHYQLDRDLNIVTLDVTDPWGGGALLPAGLLRESPEALRRADFVVLTRTASVAPDRLSVLRHEVATFVHPPALMLESRHQPACLIGLSNERAHPLSELKDRPVLAVSGIGHPESFEKSLTHLGAVIRHTARLSDHGGHPKEIWKWVAKHREPKCWVVMTEKDAMRWTGAPVSPGLLHDAYALRMDLEISAGEDHWKSLIQRLGRLTHGAH